MKKLFASAVALAALPLALLLLLPKTRSPISTRPLKRPAASTSCSLLLT